jgi:hypothetical protein
VRAFCCPLAALLFATTTALPAQSADLPDPARVHAAQAGLSSYHDVLSDMSCDAPTLTAHRLMCEDDALWQMGLLDTWAWVYAVENATGTETDHSDPPLDDFFIEARDACTDRACLVELLVNHTNGSLGGTSPYEVE